MQKIFEKYIKYIDFWLIGLVFFTVLFCKIYIFNWSQPMIDTPREIYFPKMILDGKILYKDLFNIFGPFAYLLNALIFKIFGSNLNTLYGIGYISSILMISGLYKLSDVLLNNKYYSFLIAVFAVVTSILNPDVFSYIHPYSYSLLYGLIAFIWGFYLSFKKVPFIFTGLLLGIAISCKYEFVLPVIVLFLYLINLRFNKKSVLKALIVALPLLVCLLFLFMQGLDLSSFCNHSKLIASLVHTTSYNVFYKFIGTLFSVNGLFYSFVVFLYFCLILIPLMFINKIYKQRRILNIILSILYLSASFCVLLKYPLMIEACLIFLPLLCAIIVLERFSAFKREDYFIIAILFFLGLKQIAALHIFYYGVYFAPIFLILFFYLSESNKLVQKAMAYYIVLLIVIVLKNNVYTQKNIISSVNSDKGVMITTTAQSYKINNTVEYLKQNANESDKVVVYPEGFLINYITNNPAETFYYSLTPPYLEAFGQDKIIEYFSANTPEYFVLIRSNQAIYGAKYICEDYAEDFCKFIYNNYDMTAEYKASDDDEEIYRIYKRK